MASKERPAKRLSKAEKAAVNATLLDSIIVAPPGAPEQMAQPHQQQQGKPDEEDNRPEPKRESDKKIRREIGKKARQSFEQLRSGEKTRQEIEVDLKESGLSEADVKDTLSMISRIKETEDRKTDKILRAEATTTAKATERASPSPSDQEKALLQEKGRRAVEIIENNIRRREGGVVPSRTTQSPLQSERSAEATPFEVTQPVDPRTAEREAEEQAVVDRNIEAAREVFDSFKQEPAESKAKEQAAIDQRIEDPLEEELASMYPDYVIPNRVLQTYQKLDRNVRDSIASGDEKAQQKAANRLEEFMEGQRRMEGTDEAWERAMPAPVYEYYEAKPVAVISPVEEAGVRDGITATEAHSLSEARTHPYDENSDFVETLPVRAKTTYWKLEDELQASVVSGDSIAQQKAMTALDTFIRAHGGQTVREVSAREEDPGTMTAEEARQRKIDEALDEYRTNGWQQEMPEVEEKTPLEWRAKLRGLIEGAKNKVAPVIDKAKEKVQWWKSAQEGLIRRREELDREAERIGGVENVFRALGERYNQYGWKTKLVVGASLGFGATVFASASLPATLACLSGVAVQRIAGLSTMYLKFEKSALEKKGASKWLKEKAMAKALLYTVSFGLAEKEAITLASESAPGQAIQEWLGRMLGHHGIPSAAKVETHTPQATAPHPVEAASNPVAQASAPEAPASAAPHTAISPEAPASAATSETTPNATPEAGPQPAAAPAAGAETTPSVPPEVTQIDVTASKGHGYEYMTKRLWEQLQEKHITLPANADPKSDLYQLIHATPENIDKVVHELAQQNNAFHEGSGVNARIDLSSHMTIDSNGNITLDGVHAIPDTAPATPAYHPESATAEPYYGKLAGETPYTEHPDVIPASYGDMPVAPDTPQPDTQPPSQEVHSQPAPVTDRDFVVNSHEVTIPLAEPHIYSAGKEFMVYGGSAKEQSNVITRFLTAHRDATLLGTDDTGKYRISWNLVNGKVVGGLPQKASGFLSFLNPYLSPPKPEDFTKVVE